MIVTGKVLEGKNIIAWFYPIRMKPFKSTAKVLKFNSNWKRLKYKVLLPNGTKPYIQHNQILELLKK